MIIRIFLSRVDEVIKERLIPGRLGGYSSGWQEKKAEKQSGYCFQDGWG
jgi:hypothetical protein